MKKVTSILLAAALLAVCVCALFVNASAEELEAIDLMPPEGSTWTANEHLGNTVVVSYKDGAIELAGEKKTSDDAWPSTDYDYTPFTVDPSKYDLEFDFSIVGGEGLTNPRGAISFFFNGSKSTGYSLGNTAIKPALGIEESSNDYYPGDYSAKVSLADIAASQDYDWSTQWSGALADGQLNFSGIRIFACGGGTMILRKLRLVPASSSEPIQETITVDGNLDDTGWAEDGWINVSVEDGTGSVQDTPEEKTKDAFTYKVQMRTDDEYLYVATVVDMPLRKGNGVGSESTRSGLNYRLWIHSDNEYDRYTHFYDIWPDAEGNSINAAKYNTKKDDNAGAVIADTSFKGVVKEVGEKTVFELSVKYSEFLKEGAEEIHFFINPVNGATSEYFVGVLYPPIPLELRTELDQTLMPWIRWYTDGEGVLNIAEAKLGEITPEPDLPTPPPVGEDTYAEDIQAKVGEPNADPRFNTEITGKVENGQAIFTLKLSGFKAEDQISSLIFPIFYDDERLEPAMEAAKDGSLPILSGLPGEGGDAEVWENMTVLYKADDASQTNVYPNRAHVYLQVGNPNDETKLLDENTEITATLTFDLKDGFVKAGIWMESAETVCSSWDFEDFFGEAKACVAEDETENPTPPDEPTPPDQPSEPGDAGILVFAILGVIAVAGAAFVVKVRK